MRTLARTLALLLLLAVVPSSSWAQDYGSGHVVEVPRVDPGAITIDGQADEAAWAGAQTDIDISANWISYGEVGDPLDDPDVLTETKLLWSEDTLYLYAHLYDVELFWGGDTGTHWNSDALFVGIDNSFEGDSVFTDTYDGAPQNAPEGVYTYFINAPAGFTLGWSEDYTPADSGWVDGAVFVDEVHFEWGIEAAFYLPDAELGARIGFDVGGAQASAEQCEAEGECTYAYYAWQTGAPGAGQDPGAIIRSAIEWATLHLVDDTAGDPPPGGELTVEGAGGGSQLLRFGTAETATGGYDEGLDLLLPPPPPADAFDARFVLADGSGLLRDYRAPLTGAAAATWTLQYQASGDARPVRLSWDVDALPEEGRLYLRDASGGEQVWVDMRRDTAYVDALDLGTLEIVYSRFRRDVPVAEEWNLVGLPVGREASHYQSIFPTATGGPLWAFDGSNYAQRDTLEQQTGYWLYFDAADTVEVAGAELREGRLDVRVGWNLVAGLSCPVLLGEADGSDSLLVDGTLYGFAGAYRRAETLTAGQGYWVLAREEGSVALRCDEPQPTSVPLKARSGADASLHVLRLEDAGGRAQELFFGAALPGDVEPLSYSLPPVPPEDVFDARFGEEHARLAVLEEEGAAAAVELRGVRYPLTLTAELVAGDEATYSLDGLGGELVRLDDGASVTVEEAPEALRLVRAQRVATEAASDVPLAFVLEGIYPNPLRQATTIRYGVPEASQVRVEVFDVLGRRVAVLADGRQGAGYHEVAWQPETSAGSGVYYCVVSADGRRLARSIVVVR